MTRQEYLHSSQHVAQGYNSMLGCVLCKQTMGDTLSVTDTAGNVQPLLTKNDLFKYMIMTTVASVFMEAVVKPYIIPMFVPKKAKD